MSVVQPDARWKELCEAVETDTPPKDSFLLTLYSVIKDADDEGNLVETEENGKLIYTLRLVQNIHHRYSLIAYFISGATPTQIAESLGIDEEIVEMFGALIIDMAAFRNKLELRDYALHVEETCPDEAIKLEIKCGYLYGPNYLNIFWKHGNEEVRLREKDVTKSILLLGYEKGMVARNAPIDSAASKEALKWNGQMLRAIPVHNNIDDSEDLMEEALVAIKKREEEREGERELVDPSKIVH